MDNFDKDNFSPEQKLVTDIYNDVWAIISAEFGDKAHIVSFFDDKGKLRYTADFSKNRDIYIEDYDNNRSFRLSGDGEFPKTSRIDSYGEYNPIKTFGELEDIVKNLSQLKMENDPNAQID